MIDYIIKLCRDNHSSTAWGKVEMLKKISERCATDAQRRPIADGRYKFSKEQQSNEIIDL